MKSNNSKKLKMHKLISILITLIGIALMTFMVIVEDEPDAIPLLLIVLGTGWYFITRYRIPSQHRQV
ncbi:MAG: hypothetical protein WD059_11455 [Balneolaceae bacterium]